MSLSKVGRVTGCRKGVVWGSNILSLRGLLDIQVDMPVECKRLGSRAKVQNETDI